MEYLEVINLLANTPNQPSKFKTKIQVEINDRSHETYSTGSQIKFKTSMITSILCDYSDVYILAKGSITGTPAVPNNRNKNVIFKNFDPFASCISEINNKEIDHAKDIDVKIQMYNLIEYSNSYSKTPASLWQYHQDELFSNDDGVNIDFPDDPDSASFKHK